MRLFILVICFVTMPHAQASFFTWCRSKLSLLFPVPSSAAVLRELKVPNHVPVRFELDPTVSQNSDASITVDGIRYLPFGRSVVSATEIRKVKNLELSLRIASRTATEWNLPLKTPQYIIQKSATGDTARVFVHYPDTQGEVVSSWDHKDEIDKKMLALGNYLAALVGTDSLAPSALELSKSGDDRVLVFKPRDALNAEFNAALQSRDLHLIADEIIYDRIPWNDFEVYAHQLGLDEKIISELKERNEALRAKLFERSEVFYSDPNLLFEKAQELRKLKIARLKKDEIYKMHYDIRQRLDHDIRHNTDFKNFEEYKSFIMAIPEYRTLVRELQNNYQVQLQSHSGTRLSILQEGFLSVFERGHSPMVQDANDLKSRYGVIANSLGISLEEARSTLPIYHPKSAFLFRKAEKLHEDNIYGQDAYYFDREKISKAEKEGRLIQTFSIGDSARSLHLWYGRPLLAEDFPYVAAPFLLQYREVSGQNDFGVLRYRKGIWGMSDTLPKFKGGLEEKLRIPLMNHIPPMMAQLRDADNFIADYFEAQFWGDVGLEEVSRARLNSRTPLSSVLRSALELSGARIYTY